MRLATNCEHTDRKHQARGMCASCYTKDWEKRTPDHNSGNRWLKNNPDKAKFHLRKQSMKVKYGITHEERESMWEKQGGKCANAGCDFVAKELWPAISHEGLDVDHNHETGKVRGLLCRSCNTAMGLLKENSQRILGLQKYIEGAN